MPYNKLKKINCNMHFKINIRNKNKRIRGLIHKHIIFSFVSIFVFFKKLKKTNLPLYLIKYIYFCLINYLYTKFIYIFLLNKNIYINLKNTINVKLPKLFNFTKKTLFNSFYSKFFFEKKNLYEFLEFQKFKKDLNLNLFLNFWGNNFLKFLSTTLTLVFFNKIKKPMINFFVGSKIKQKNLYFSYFLNNKKFMSSAYKYQEIFLLPFFFNKKIKKLKIKNLKIFESIFYFKFIRRFRTLFFLFFFYLLLFWFNKLILKINLNIVFIHNNSLIKFFNNFKNLINLNIKHVWLVHKILIPNFNLNYILYNNIIKKW